MSDAEESKAAVRAYFDRALAGDPTLPELLADDVVWWVPPGSPLAGTHQGRAAVLAMLAKAFALYDVPTMKLELPLLFAEGPHVCVLFRLAARTAKGAPHAADYLAYFRVEDGRIREVREFFDTHTVRKVVFGLPA